MYYYIKRAITLKYWIVIWRNLYLKRLMCINIIIIIFIIIIIIIIFNVINNNVVVIIIVLFIYLQYQ